MKLSVRNLVKDFGDIRALDGVSFEAEAGAPLGLLGRNGAGKTTSMRIIMGLFPPTSGEVLLDGRPLAGQDVKLGYLPEERGLYRKHRIAEQLAYFARLRGMSAPAAAKAVDYWLERLELTEYRNKKVETLSKGNAQRIQLALALINDPDIVILDEPFSGLDPVNAMQLKNIIKEHAGRDRIILFSSHQMSAVEDFCDSIVIVNKGRVALSGRLSDIRAGYPKDRVRLAVSGGGMKDFNTILKDYNAYDIDGMSAEVRLPADGDANKLLTRLLYAGFTINKFETVEPTLEEIFVKTSEDAGDLIELKMEN